MLPSERVVAPRTGAPEHSRRASAPIAPEQLACAAEVSERLVGSPAFKAGGTGDPRPAGSIPVHLREPMATLACRRFRPVTWSRRRARIRCAGWLFGDPWRGKDPQAMTSPLAEQAAPGSVVIGACRRRTRRRPRDLARLAMPPHTAARSCRYRRPHQAHVDHDRPAPSPVRRAGRIGQRRAGWTVSAPPPIQRCSR